MEIKTTEYIRDECFDNNKMWVSVEDIIEELEDLHEMRRLELIKQLKGNKNDN